MSRISFDNFAQSAAAGHLSDTEAAGRYDFQRDAELQMVADVALKLNLQASDQLLDIGCGPGRLLLPLSRLVANACGIDNAAMIERVRARAGPDSSIRTLTGNFLDLDLSASRYDKILVHGVVQYLGTAAEVTTFIVRAASLLTPRGRLLIGDLPNETKKARFLGSTTGKRMAVEWASLTAHGHPMDGLPRDPSVVSFNDDLVMHLLSIVRAAGYESYLLPQPAGLPFGRSREDMLVVAGD